MIRNNSIHLFVSLFLTFVISVQNARGYSLDSSLDASQVVSPFLGETRVTTKSTFVSASVCDDKALSKLRNDLKVTKENLQSIILGALYESQTIYGYLEGDLARLALDGEKLARLIDRDAPAVRAAEAEAEALTREAERIAADPNSTQEEALAATEKAEAKSQEAERLRALLNDRFFRLIVKKVDVSVVGRMKPILRYVGLPTDVPRAKINALAKNIFIGMEKEIGTWNPMGEYYIRFLLLLVSESVLDSIIEKGAKIEALEKEIAACETGSQPAPAPEEPPAVEPSPAM